MRASDRSLPALLLLSLAGACAPDFAVSVKNEDVEPVVTLIEVEPRTIDFGRQTSQDVVSETVTLTNIGTSVLQVEDILLKADASFALDLGDQVLPFDLQPNQSRTLDVVFTPLEGGDLGGEVTILSDAANEPEAKVPFVGEGAVPDLKITPNPMQFGTRLIPCGDEQSFVISNQGFEPVEVTGVSLGGSAEQLAFPVSVALPFTLRRGESQIVPVRFAPDFPQQFTAELVVDSSDLGGRQQVPILGAAVYGATRTETFVVQEEPELDVLFAVDQSCSMDDQAAVLAQEFGRFIGILDAANVAWEVGVYTGGADGCFVNGIISKTRYPSDWRQRFNAAVGFGDDALPNTEKLLQGVALAVGQDQLGRCNQGFHAGSDPLQVIYVSDERDQSFSGTNPPSPTYWVNELAKVQAYAGAAPLKAHAIVDVRSVCGDGTGPGGYRDAAVATGGLVLDVCSSWASQFGSIAQAALLDFGFFELASGGVDPDSLEVTVNGSPAPTGWTYDGARNGILLDEIPPAGTSITVTYGVAPSCGP